MFTFVLDVEHRCWLFSEVVFVRLLHMDTVRGRGSKDLASLFTFLSQAVFQKTRSGDAKDIILTLTDGICFPHANLPLLAVLSSGGSGTSFANDSQRLECSEEVWAAWRALLFPILRKNPFVLTEAVEFRSRVTAGTLKACALIGLHMIAEEATSSSCSGLSLELGGVSRLNGPRNPFWKDDEGGWTESE